MEVTYFGRVCWVCLILLTLIATNAPKFFPPLHSCFLPSQPLLARSSSTSSSLPGLPVLTAHILEEEEQTQDICGKWDYETGLTRPVLTAASVLMVHNTMQAIVTECRVCLYFLKSGILGPRFELRGWGEWFSRFDNPPMCNGIGQTDAALEHLVLKTIWNSLNNTGGQGHFGTLCGLVVILVSS